MGWKTGAASLALLFSILGVLLHPSRSPINAVRYVPPQPPSLTQPPYHDPAMTLRTDAEFLAVGEVHGPEDIIADSSGVLYTGSQDGWIQRITLQEGAKASVENWVNVGSHPLGFDWDREGRLLACVPDRGLLRVGLDGEVEVLSIEAGGTPYGLIDNVVVAEDGLVYFTDATFRHKLVNHSLDFLEGRAQGRLLRYDPVANLTDVVASGLYFPNGIALSPGGESLLFAESSRYRVRRYWLRGPKEGTLETFIDNLPGVPDNINMSPDGLLWVALFIRRPFVMDNFLHPYPVLKNITAMLPKWTLDIVATIARFGHVIAIDKDGTVVRSYMDPGGKKLSSLSTAKEIDGHLYLGSLTNSFIARVKLPSASVGSDKW